MLEDPGRDVSYWSRKGDNDSKWQNGQKQAWLHSTKICGTGQWSKTNQQLVTAKPCIQRTLAPTECTTQARNHIARWCLSYAEQSTACQSVLQKNKFASGESTQQTRLNHRASNPVPLTFLLMCSRRCSWPCRKQRCWNSVSSRSGLTSPPCSMFTTFLKPSVWKGCGWRVSGPMFSSWPPPEVRDIYAGYLFEVLQRFLHHIYPSSRLASYSEQCYCMLKLQRENFTEELTE